ncbi:Protein of unknown function DUF668 [Macleaya cordata]|uniref:DUF668 domain-containing protein n=1 Tax=Macleaya cordata TaxID=56857 RepID=A0A200Q742_MACCD|nr:Protein of unknown function DUF668 [Macleaya cordata]
MGGVCSAGARLGDSDVVPKSPGYPGVLKGANCFDKNKKESITYSSDSDSDIFDGKNPRKFDCVELLSCSPFEFKPSKQDRTTAKQIDDDEGTLVGNKVLDNGSISGNHHCRGRPTPKVDQVPQTSSLLGRAGIVGLEKAVEVLDTIGSSMSNFKSSSTFIPGTSSRESEISIHAFEVASTITKGANILRSLSKESIQFLKDRILQSTGVQQLVSIDMEELLSIAAADKREEFELFSREVVRFGNLCKDPRWHNLGRYFQKLGSDADNKTKEEAEMTMEELVSLAQHTSELYHELRSLEKTEQDHRRVLEEVESSQLPGKGESLMLLNCELNHQKKLVRNLKKKSLWSKNLEEVMEKLVDVVALIHQEISEAFGNNGITLDSKEPNHIPQRLGAAGLALHYASIINQIEKFSILISRPYSLPPNTRDTLYHGLPSGVKAALRSRLQSINSKELTELEIRAEMEKTFHWLVPLAANTIKAHQGFGSVGEWATACNTFNKKISSQNNNIRLQTLYHADKEKIESCILELVTWLHHLMSQIRQRYYGSKPLVPVRSPKRKNGLVLQLQSQQEPSNAHSSSRTEKILQLPKADQDLLEDVSSRTSNPGTSKSQEFSTGKKEAKQLSLSRSCGSTPSPTSELSVTQNLEHTRTNMLDIIDRLDETTH